MSARPPLPPNRACGSPAHGSPVESFRIVAEYPFNAPNGESTLNSGGLRPRFRYQNHQQGVPSISSQWHGSEARFFPSSETCLAIPGTQFLSVRRSLESSVSSSLFLTNFPQHGFAAHASRPVQQHRYYSASDSCLRHLGGRSPRLSRTNFPSFHLQPQGCPGCRFPRQLSASDVFQASPSPSQLADTPRRIEFVILRTDSSLPVALHPASRRRSYLQLRGFGLPRHGLAPCCLRAFTGALGGPPPGPKSWWLQQCEIRGEGAPPCHGGGNFVGAGLPAIGAGRSGLKPLLQITW